MSIRGALTVIVQVAKTPLPSIAIAVMLAVPVAIAVTRPFSSTVAVPSLLLVHVNDWSEAFIGETDAINCCVVPLSIVRVDLSSIMFVTLCSTVTSQDALESLPSAAITVSIAVPGPTAVTN
ncbi:hypothetical protein SDC9_145715 [bioreactor metagenome]|uniref:Uncharacterized protein n=1 Tax=bioreactor metagenome TaxID=1076179 RepID=A0A645E9C9_9ZZZZ